MTEQLERTLAALERNNMKALYAENAAAVCQAVESLLPEGSTIAAGGSMSLAESGVRALIEQPRYRFMDRNRPGITPEQRQEVYRSTVGCDFYFCSANAVTEKGELVNVDGVANRVSAIAFGPKRVIVIAGVNKLVPDVKTGLLRVKQTAAPKNAVRLGLDTPCARLGHCVSLEKSADPDFTDGCACETRICASYLISGRQRIPGRITVILCGEPLGY